MAKPKERIEFKTKYDASGDVLLLDVTVNKALQSVLMDCCVPEVCDDLVSVGGKEYSRYLVRRVVMASTSHYANKYKYAVFIKDLVDNGSLSLSFEDSSSLKNTIDNIKSVTKEIIEAHHILKKEQKVVVTFESQKVTQ